MCIQISLNFNLRISKGVIMKKNLLITSVQNLLRIKYIPLLLLPFFFSINAWGASCSSNHTETACNAVATCAWVDATCVANSADIDLLIAKTPSSRVVDLNQTVTYSLVIANEAREDAEDDNHVTVTDTLPQIPGLTDFHLIDDGGFDCTLLDTTTGDEIPLAETNPDTTVGETLTSTSVLTCADGEIDGRTGNSGVPGLARIWYSFRAPDYNTELNNTVVVSALNDTVDNDKEAFARVFVFNGSLVLNTPPPEHADIIDTYTGATAYNNGTSQVIQTKIAAKTFTTITAVHLNGSSEPVPFVPTDPDMSFIVIPYLSDNSCITQEPILDSSTNAPLVFDITTGVTAVEMSMTVPSFARRASRLLISYIDLGAILDNTGVKCVYSSATTGNLAGLGQCINSANNYYDAFGLSSYERCNVMNGSPCDSANGGYSCGPNDTDCTGYNPLYDNELGCLMCTLNAFPECSTDNFAIRPQQFDINTSHQNFPNLLRAGEDYSIALTAPDAAGAATDQYTITDHPFNDDLNASAEKYFNDNPPTLDTNNLLSGNLDMNDSYIAYAINGLSSLSATIEPAVSEEAIHISYDDVGKITLHIQDQNWAEIDNDDTPMTCDENGTYICGDRNVTFIPHHFGFAELNITNHAGPDNNFTYIADNRGMPSTTPPTRSPMAARVHTQIRALTKDGNITANFREDVGTNKYYENNISVTQVVTVPAFGNPNGYLYPDANESNITNQLIGFGRLGEDAAGTRNILWNESTYPLEFNFQREINEPANPFDVNGSYFSISMISQYVDPEDGDTADINGSRIGDQNTSTTCATDEGCVELNAENNATFHYARTRPSKFFYENAKDSVATPIAIDVYCAFGALSFTACDKLGIDTVNGQINEANWWLSIDHKMSNNDGNVTLERIPIPTEGASADWTVTSDDWSAVRTVVSIDANGIDGNITVTDGSNPTLPLTVGIDLVTDDTLADYTNPWLIYNKDSAIVAPSPFYKVRFIGTSGWTGIGETGYVLETNASSKRTKRMAW